MFISVNTKKQESTPTGGVEVDHLVQEEAQEIELVTWAAVYPQSDEPVTHYYHAHQALGYSNNLCNSGHRACLTLVLVVKDPIFGGLKPKREVSSMSLSNMYR